MSISDQTNIKIERSNKAIQTSVSNLQKVVGELTTLGEAAVELNTELSLKQQELQQLDSQLAIKVREQNAELALKVKENAELVLLQLLEDQNLTSISEKDLSTLRSQLAEAEQAVENAVADAVKDTKKSLDQQHAFAVQSLKSSHEVEIAGIKAELVSLKERNEFLTGHVAKLEAKASEELKARIEIATAEAQRAPVSITTGSK